MDSYKYHVTIYKDGSWMVRTQTQPNQPVGTQFTQTGRASSPEQAEADARTYVQQQKLDRIRSESTRFANAPKTFTL